VTDCVTGKGDKRVGKARAGKNFEPLSTRKKREGMKQTPHRNACYQRSRRTPRREAWKNDAKETPDKEGGNSIGGKGGETKRSKPWEQS